VENKISVILGIVLLSISFPLAFADTSVDIPAGTSVPGCEETNSCWSPADITINVGDTVEWVNIDTAAHTVTGGSPANGVSGVFDSGLVMGGATYSFKFDNVGNYDYFCMVHPWMIGEIVVNAAMVPLKKPVLKYDLSPSTIYAGESIKFDASESYDPDGRIVKYQWWFGDGKTETGSIVYHSYPAEVHTNGVLQITDNDGQITKENISIKVLKREPTPEPEPEPTCGAGTELVNGVCVAIGNADTNTPSGGGTSAGYEWIAIGVVGAAIVGVIGFVLKNKKTSKPATVTTSITESPKQSTDDTQGRTCNVCSTHIPQGVNVCPSCGDTYS